MMVFIVKFFRFCVILLQFSERVTKTNITTFIKLTF
jgi:hypothetical protein